MTEPGKRRLLRPNKPLPKGWLDEDERYYQGVWTAEENRRYFEFAREHAHELDKQVARSSRVYHRMSAAIPTRSSTQCRSHHQKMVKSGKVPSLSPSEGRDSSSKDIPSNEDLKQVSAS